MERVWPDEWALKNRVYKSSHDRSGPRDPSITPYMIPFCRAFDIGYQIETYGRRFDSIVYVTGSQTSKTEAMLDVIGSRMDQRPAPAMYLGPTQGFVKDEIEPRIMDMIQSSSGLKARFVGGKRRSKFRKIFAGVPLALAWAGSAAQVAGMAARDVYIDELDRISASIKGEGDIWGLTEARGFSFRDRQRAAISTPLIGIVDIKRDEFSGLEFWQVMDVEEVESPIWRLWQSGTMHHFAWPCPHCEEFFIPRFKQLRWPEDASQALARQESHIECPCCGLEIEEHHKEEMNARGEFVAPGEKIDSDGVKSGSINETTTLSFWTSALCSPFVTLGERAASYIAAKESGTSNSVQSVINTGFGELYAPGGGDVPEWQEVAALKQGYERGEVPDGVRLVTLTADIQKNSIPYTIRGWGHRGTSWLIDFGELHGPTAETKIWGDLATLLTSPVGDFVIYRAFIDSGYRPGKPFQVPVNRVYDFCRRFRHLTYPTKGRATLDGKPLVVKKFDVNRKGQIKKYGLDLVLLDTDYGKSWVHERIKWPDDQPGAWYLPQDVTEDYCKQIVSEARLRKPNGAPQWIARSRNNHFLDCEAMQAALGHMLNVHLYQAPEKTGTDEVERRPRRGRSGKSALRQPAKIEKPLKSTVKSKAAPPDRLSKRKARRARIAELTSKMY